jgi:hypothetical protein
MKKLFIILISFCFIANSYAQIGINATNTPPDASAMLDVSSTTKGVLIPRMTTIQKNNLPNKSDGLLVYDTDLKVFSYYKHYGGPLLGFWQDFGNPPATPPSVWNTNGNDINSSNIGNVGIGTSVPNAKLEIQADATDGLKIVQTGYNNGILINSTTGNNKAGLNVSNQGSGYSGFFSSYGSGNGLWSEILNPSSNWNAINANTAGTGNAGNFNAPNGVAGYFNSNSGKAIIVSNGNVGFGSFNSPNKFSVGGNADFTGKVGIGVETLNKAQLEVASNFKTTGLFGSTSTGISLQQNFPTIGFNQYRDGNNLQRYIGTGFAMGNFLDPTTGSMYWAANPTGTAGNVTASETIIMNLTKDGRLGIGTYITPNSTLLAVKGTAFDGSAVFTGTTHSSVFHYSTNEDTYIRGGKNGSKVIINDGALGSVGIGISDFDFPAKLSVYQPTIESNSNTHVLHLRGQNPVQFFADQYNTTRGYIKGITNRSQTPQFTREGLEIGVAAGDLYLTANYSSSITISGLNNNVGIGTYPTNDYRLSVNGTTRTKELIVETGWADYVFDDNYKLKSIDELEVFVKENKHLPNIPSASEIESKGLKVGETNKAMMEKIEELALYIIQLKKEIDILKSKN